MELKKLIVHGFKSFADRVEFTFEHGITGVVGPNGCGKSNISDAVRWVLGEQSAKSLRGAKMEDVIFNGTEKRRRQAFCEVTLVFDNTDHALQIDFSEVAISRRVYRNGEGEYQINGAACRLKDIVDLFRDTGLGRDGYSIIGQGRIDEVLSQKSEDRRQIFEEAAGIMKFKSRKLESERKLAGTSANLERVDDILTELSERVEPLKKQSEEAREYLALRDELRRLDINIFLLRSEKYETRLNELRISLNDIKKQSEQAEREMAEMTARRDESQMELDRLELDAAEKREVVQMLIRETEEHEGEVKLLRERISSGERELARLTAQRDNAMGGGAGINEQIEKMTSALENERLAVEESRELLESDEVKLAAAEKELAEAEEKAETLKSEIISAMNRLSDVRSQSARLGAMKTALENQLEALSGSAAHDEEGLRSLSEHVSSAREQLNDERLRANELGERVDEINTRVQEAAGRGQRLSNEVNALRDRRQQVESRLKLLREMQRDYEGLNNSVKQVLMQSRRTQNSGVHGVVADIIKVPEKLERAVDMVLGGALQNIVVDRDEDAKRMIEYLRANRFGRATFLPITSVRGRTLSAAERSVLTMKGCVGLASELVEFDPKYQGVVDNLLGRTVVAENLDAGIAIQRAGRYQFRLVTLEGDVMHSGGSITGGSVQSRVTNLLSRSREIEQSEKLLNSIEEELSEDIAGLQAIEEERTALKKERGELYDAVHAQEIICARAEENLKAAQEEYNNYTQRLEKLQSERERLRAQLDQTNEALAGFENRQDNAKQNTEEMQAQVRSMQNEIFGMRSAVEKLREEVSDARVSFATMSRDYSTHVRELERLKTQAGDMEKLLNDTLIQLDECRRNLDENAAALENCLNGLDRAGKGLSEARADFNASEERRVATQKSVKDLSSQIDVLRDGLESLSDANHRTEMHLQRSEGEFKQITDRIWEEYELTYAGAQEFREEDFKLTESERRVSQIRQRIRQMGVVNVAAVDEYRQTVQRLEELNSQKNDLEGAIADLNQIIAELEHNMERQFRSRFDMMNENFKHTFSRLFGGGTAELRLSDPKDALNCGIDIVAQPPGKKLQTLSLLSGGERALTAIAILFAMLEIKPTPFCILDEIEAALDDANIDNFAEYLKTYSAKTQFVVITHRKGTMERCEALYGVVMEEKGVSKLVSVALNEAV